MKYYAPDDYYWTVHNVQITIQYYDETFVIENEFEGNVTGAEVLSLVDNFDFMWGAVKVIKGKIDFLNNGIVRLYFKEGFRDFESEELLDYVVKLEIVGVEEIEHP